MYSMIAQSSYVCTTRASHRRWQRPQILSAMILDAFCIPLLRPRPIRVLPVFSQLLDIARCAKESEAAVLRATYERRASQHARDKEVGYTGSVTASNELWRVPPPPVIKDVEGEGGTSSPKALQWVDVRKFAVLRAEESEGMRCDAPSA